MKYRVHILRQAELDLLDIYTDVSAHATEASAERILDKLEQTCRRLAVMPGRGRIPPELRELDVMDYREVRFKGYRTVYEITGREVYVHAVLDGRRDIGDILQRSLLR